MHTTAIQFYENHVTHNCFDIARYLHAHRNEKEYIGVSATCSKADASVCIKQNLLKMLNDKEYKSFMRHVANLALQQLTIDKYDYYEHTPYTNEVSQTYEIDYVNASFVPLHDGKTIIAAQMPKQEYTHRFNEMIKKANCSLVVCLANIQKELLTDYKQNADGYERISCENWNDMGTADVHILDKLYKEFSAKYEKANSNIVVHCKAGLGRTGVFILHHILTTLKIENNKDFLTIFLYLRSKRNNLVFTHGQLKHIHERHIAK